MELDVVVPAPEYRKIPTIGDLLDVSALMVCFFFKGAEFFRCSYFVSNMYSEATDTELTEKNFDITKVRRKILNEKPKIVETDVDWNEELSQLYENMIKSTDEADLT